MLRKQTVAAIFACALVTPALAQQPAQQTTTRRTTTTTTAPVATAPAATTTQETTTTTTTRSRSRRTAPVQAASVGATQVRAAFDKLLDGIRASDVDQVMSVYWNSPQLTLFNNNGTVTRTWDQVRSNRESSYPNITDVVLEPRDVRVQMLGRDGAAVSALWTQSQTARGVAERATGRMTVVFQRVGNEWRAVHAHTSPDAPDPSRLLPSERPTVAPTEVVPGARPTATPTTTTPTRP